MEYNFKDLEQKWQQYWIDNQTYKVEVDNNRPKYYVLDMFPYPSGAGLHVGHPLGYIASDIYSRYKRLNGFNVLHPMGYDAYGLPAEQYAIQTGQHPAITTEKNLNRYRQQLDKIGFCYDWDREVKTCDPDYYKWTQWAFIQMFNHYYCNQAKQARPISELVDVFAKTGTEGLDLACSEELVFTADEWKAKSDKEQQEILLNYRLAYLADTMVNWCPALGTVLANDEVKEGVSVRGGHPVEQKVMRQWSLRVSAYAERLLTGLDNVDWSDSLKEIQRNWIGRSEGAEMTFKVKESDVEMEIFTTRADTVYGVTFMVLAPESELVDQLTTAEQRAAVDDYILETKKRTERERLAEVKKVSGVFSGSYAINPLTNEEIPVWISDYVLAGYGTGAIMAVPAHDSRDFAFAKHFDLPIRQVVIPEGAEATDPATWNDSIDSKEGTMVNSGILDGLSVKEGIAKTKEYIAAKGIGKVKVNYRLRDAIFSRQRYWGEPFPVYYKDDMPYMLDESKLPLTLPEIDKYLPTEQGEPPLGRAKDWKTEEGYPLELNTMPGFAGSSAYYLRYMDPKNDKALVGKEANEYWQDVDLYIGGTEHATGHLIYSRFWNKFLYDMGAVIKDEPYKKLINQGMIQGRSNFVYRVKGSNTFVSYNLRKDYDVTEIHVDVNIVRNDELDMEAFKKWSPDYANAEFILEGDKYICGYAVEKMSKSMYNVVNPDDIIEEYGADTLRLYEMFLGPLEQSKPWDTNGIDGVHKFLKKTWRLFYNGDQLAVSDDKATPDELKVLHRTIKKITDDVERFSFNTCVSAFMICVNELNDLKCNKREILEPLLALLAPFAPHISEELWSQLGHTTSVVDTKWPELIESHLVESTVTYPVSFNGKMRFKIDLPADMNPKEVEATVLAHQSSAKWIEGKTIRKVIVVPKKIINIVVG
nr:leucine--tRNA ligase [uncultured Carboxylicivirga sp.]